MSESPSTNKPTPPSIWRTLSGAVVAGTIAFPLAKLSSKIAQSFAEHPFTSDNQTAVKIAIALKTLVVGLSTLATGIFCMAALGLGALSIQIFWQNLTSSPTPPEPDSVDQSEQSS
ncbi:DUF3082 domain-containing protein [Acaryochloris marina]|uniref:DUF3082 domain-containing protein n=1 Tax=Acaryochloris marina (strain MBIC 11017) TaxID=329726 RepID=B0C4K0_ACAM1|nr:DUF3082 domain-containing protein [Acaryochloris marina]ABW29883.1 conserved hypothetical protein [Acaryochloris marina MBIC11017]